MAESLLETHDLERDLFHCSWLVAKVRARRDYAQNLYAALCNNQFQKQEVWNVLKDQRWSCSWRSAGGIVADLEDRGHDYMDWYCSGMINGHPDDDSDPDPTKDFVPEGTITEEILQDLDVLGWRPVVDQ